MPTTSSLVPGSAAQASARTPLPLPLPTGGHWSVARGFARKCLPAGARLPAGALMAAAVGWVAMGSCSAASASSVTIYGIYDLGLTQVSNIAGSSVTRMDDSILQGNRLGFRGLEELGGGLSAFFTLEMGFAGDTGALRQGGLGFGRASLVGLSHKSWGEFSMGRQFDQMNTTLIRFSPVLGAGIYSATVGDADRVGGNWLNNMVTYRSPVIANFRFTGQYSFSENGTSTTNAGRAYSIGVTYARDGFNAGAAMTEIRGSTITPGAALGVSQFMGAPIGKSTPVKLSNYRTAGAGAGYTMGRATLSALATHTRYESEAGRTQALSSFAIPLAYRLTDQWQLQAAFSQSRMAQSRWRNTSLIADYLLSKRTDLYVSAHWEKASGDGTSAVLFTLPGSSTSRQSALRVGLRHRF